MTTTATPPSPTELQAQIEAATIEIDDVSRELGIAELDGGDTKPLTKKIQTAREQRDRATAALAELARRDDLAAAAARQERRRSELVATCRYVEKLMDLVEQHLALQEQLKGVDAQLKALGQDRGLLRHDRLHPGDEEYHLDEQLLSAVFEWRLHKGKVAIPPTFTPEKAQRARAIAQRLLADAGAS